AQPPLPPPPPVRRAPSASAAQDACRLREAPAELPRPRPPPPPVAGNGSAEQGLRVPSCWGRGAERLTQLLLEQDKHLVPTEEQYALKRWLETTLKPLLEKHSGGVFHNFGSCENGFWMEGSDVDACLVIPRCTKKPSWLTKLRLVQSLAEREKLGTAEVVRGARVPVAKLVNASGAELVDVSVNNVAALENSRFVGTLARLDPRVPGLGRFIKYWASQRRINK
ncbi:unnamed protein product, partial [Polarella glacialis]